MKTINIDDSIDYLLVRFANAGFQNRFLLQLHKWLEDPIENNSILSEVIDMPSMARWFLLAELAKEHDGYVASMYFKVVGGKLYHASPWYVCTPFWLVKLDSIFC